MKYRCGFLAAYVKDDDFQKYGWLKDVSLQCGKLVLGIPDNDAVQEICDTAGAYDAVKVKEYWLNIKWIDDVVILGKDSLRRRALPEGNDFDVCFFGSDFGRERRQAVNMLAERGISCVDVLPAGIQRPEEMDALKLVLSHSAYNRKIILFGTGKYFDYYMERYGGQFPPSYAVDNNRDRQDMYKEEVRICPPDNIKSEKPEDVLIVICCKNYLEIEDQICSYGDYDYRTLIRQEEMAVLEEYPVIWAAKDADDETLKRIHAINYDMLEEFDSFCRRHDIEYFLNYGSVLGAVRHKGFIPWDNDIDTVMKRDEYEKLTQYKQEISDQYFWLEPDCLGNQKYFDCVPRLGYKFVHVNEDEDFCRYYNNLYNGIHLDIFLIDKTRDNFRGRLQRFELAVLYGLMNAYRHPKFFEDYDRKMQRRNKILCSIGRHISLPWLKKRADKAARRFNNDPNAEYYFISNDALHKLTLLFPRELFDYTVNMPFGRVNAKVSCDADQMCRIIFGDYMQLPPKEQRVPHFGRRLLKAGLFVFDEIRK